MFGLKSNAFSSFLLFFFCLVLLGFFDSAPFAVHGFRFPHHRSLADSDCPMNFAVLRKFLDRTRGNRAPNTSSVCQYALQGLHLVQAELLRTAGLFVPPPAAANSCWVSYQSLAGEYIPNFDIRSQCGFQTQWISEGCMNITSRSEFESKVRPVALQDLGRACNQSLENNSPCAACTTSLSRLQATYLNQPQAANVSDCTAFSFIYAAGVVNSFGPTDDGTAQCLFFFLKPLGSSGRSHKALIIGVTITCVVVLVAGAIGIWFVFRKRRQLKWMMMKKKSFVRTETIPSSSLNQLGVSTTLTRFTIDEIKEATRNFSRDNIIGRGGYGNVYRGILWNGVEVALKRFKNCSAAGDASFTHEVEVIASVRHVNLVALRGYCVATTSFEGHQRIIVCDLMRNGSLHDHLFGSFEKKLSWPIRQKIALTEKSDVFSFGVVLLELLSGKKALVSTSESQSWLVTDWAWSLVRKGRALDVIEEGMDELGPGEILEKYVLVAVLSSHPQLHARPTMDQIVKILETDLPVPSIPERPISIVANIEDIERSASSSGSGNLTSSAGYQPFTFETTSPSTG
ncbi:hypothetical protein MRB53_010807 [Persea americana]|uniref:Uncharacterized protein n=1 Tax=Persea americana TaxID=3435 RepID=A0ACC2LSV3_PERAE|nr:hypothetical protein MRB53_010807 [Persea americana]